MFYDYGKNYRAKLVTAPWLLGNTNVDSSEFISILADCAPSLGSFNHDNSSVEALELLSYESVVNILGKWKNKREHYPAHRVLVNAVASLQRIMTPIEQEAEKYVTKCYRKCCGN